MKKPDRDVPVLAIASPRPEEIAAFAEEAGWRVRYLPLPVRPYDLEGVQAVLADMGDGYDAQLPFPFPVSIPVIALVGQSTAHMADALLHRGVTHFLPWPAGSGLLNATLKAACGTQTGRDLTGISDCGPILADAMDELTGLTSRRAARDWLQSRLGDGADKAIGACLLVGISQFASVNAAYGKSAGDAVLARVAKRIERYARRILGDDVLVARMGGTEYLIAYSAPTAEAEGIDPEELARRILSSVCRPFVADDKVIRLTARCGVALPAQDDDASRMLRRASAALADARRSPTGDIVKRAGAQRRGRNAADDSDRLEADLRLALDAGEIGIVYQPQYDSHSDRIVGVEALARWNHPKLGQLDAGTLFEAADRSDHLLPLSLHIQRRALDEAGRWPAHLDGLRLSINVTAADLAQEDFVERLLSMVDESGFPRHRLTVEITETGLIENIERAGALLQELRRQQLSVAIDDFGTGYSSLAYLKALHPDYLKIDHSLSRDILGTPRDRIIVRAIIAMARSLALTVIAEGVESEKQLMLLAREGCDIYQGFLRSPPVTSEGLEKLVEKGS